MSIHKNLRGFFFNYRFKKNFDKLFFIAKKHLSGKIICKNVIIQDLTH